NPVFPTQTLFYWGEHYAKSYRAHRIETLLQKTPKHSLKTMRNIQHDIHVPDAALYLDLMIKGLSPTAQKKYASLLQILRTWNRRASLNQVGPTLFRTWFVNLQHLFFQKQKWIPTQDIIAKLLHHTFQPKNFTLQQLLEQSLQKTQAQLTKALGPSHSTWTWKRYHFVRFRHLSRNPVWHPPQQPIAGDEETVYVAPSKGKGPFYASVTPSYQFLIELRPGKVRSWGVLAGKQQDHKPDQLSKQQKLWLKQQYRSRPFYKQEVKQASRKTFVLKP
ncbi:MAG: penicillin acylase family protein, partial [Myxococcota bacterium]